VNLRNFFAPSKRRDVYKVAVMLSYGALKLFPVWDPDFGGLVMPMCYAQVNSSRVYEGCDPNGSNA
jgi:hypothetical protein